MTSEFFATTARSPGDQRQNLGNLIIERRQKPVNGPQSYGNRA
jgi:hypothetical protein